MSTASRLISGSAASWAQIGVTITSQIVLVPLYLSHWDVQTYGIWLATQALSSILFTLDTGHQEYLAYEFLRIGGNNRSELSKYLWSGIGTGIIISAFQLLLIILFLATDALPVLLGESDSLHPAMTYTVGIILLLNGTTWLISASIPGLVFRVLAPFGYYPRMAWWNLSYTIISALGPIIAVVLSASLLTTCMVASGVTLLYNIPLYIDLFRLLRKEKIMFSYPSWEVGSSNFVRSLAIFGRILLENVRQQGVRLVMAPLSGVAGLAAFSTMRTGANVALQGLNTITRPLMPDMMRFLHQRDQARSELAFGTVWIMVVALMAPAIVVLQAFIEPLYTAWTRGQIPLDPWLFGVLSLSVLVYAVVQPAIAVVVGNNLLKPQLLLSLIAAIMVIGGAYILVPIVGIRGGGLLYWLLKLLLLLAT